MKPQWTKNAGSGTTTAHGGGDEAAERDEDLSVRLPIAGAVGDLQRRGHLRACFCECHFASSCKGIHYYITDDGKNKMSAIGSATFQCPKCRTHQTVSIYESVTANKDTALKKRILDKSIFLQRCTNCRTPIELTHNLLYNDPSQELAIWFVDGGSVSQELEDAMDSFGMVVPRTYRLRLAYTLEEMIEKILIFENGVNDWLIHLIKMTKLGDVESDTSKIRLAAVRRMNDGSWSLTFNLLALGKSIVLSDISKDFMSGVALWHRLESELDWTHVSDNNCFEVFRLFRTRFPDA